MIAEAPRTLSGQASAGPEPGHLGELQRARLIAAAGQVACEEGIANVTVAHIVERAGVSRRTFYEIFVDSADCLRWTLESALERAQAQALDAWRSSGTWRERVRRSLIELLCLFDEDRVLARLLLVESLGAGSSVLERRTRVVESLIDAVCSGATRDSDPDVTRLAVEGSVGGVLGVLHSRVSQGSADRLVGLTGALMSMLVLPCLGARAARRELDRPVQMPEKKPVAGDAPLRSDPFKDAGMRLTYRTVRVLGAVAENPGSSNRQLGDLAEMSDQGQVSKLLARLERAGIIANRGNWQPGEANAWALTAVGEQVTSRIAAHTRGSQRVNAQRHNRAHRTTDIQEISVALNKPRPSMVGRLSNPRREG